MKIKRIFAENMRQAMEKVRAEHGPDAVILSSRQVEGGVEVVSAIDYDEEVIHAAADSAPPPVPEPASSKGAFASTLDELRRRAQRQAQTEATPPEPDLTASPLRGSGRNPEAEAEARAAERERKARAQVPQVEWSQDPAIRELREEMKTLRTLFENQVALLGWNAQGRQQPARTLLLRQLTEMGLAPDICRKLTEHVTEKEGLSDPEACWTRALELVARNLPIAQSNLIEDGGIAAVIGPTGVGKTTTVAKLAARFALRHGKRHVALISTDNFRMGAQDQLRSFARILDVPMYTARTADELTDVLETLKDKRLVLIDTAGMGQRDMRLSEQFHTLQENRFAIDSYLVLSANAQLATLNETMRAFKGVRPAACIITKLDEATSLGGVLTAALRYRVPLAYLGTGQRVPEDLTSAMSDRLIDKALTLVERYSQDLDDEMLALTVYGTANAG